MPKRKRDGDEDDEVATTKPDGIKQQRVSYKLQQGVKRVVHAFKLAKGFERQKLSRRRKSATTQQKAEDVVRIDAEVVALKALDQAAAAQQHLYKSLLKIKAVAEHPDLPAVLVNKARDSKITDVPTLNVIARLCKSNPAKEALAPAIADVQNALGLEGGSVARKKRKRADDYEREKGGEAVGRPLNAKVESKKPALPRSNGDAVEADSEDEDDFADYDDRIAGSSDDEGGAELNDPDGSDQSVGELERELEAEGVRHRKAKRPPNTYNHTADLSLSDASSSAPSPSPEPQKAPGSAVKRSSFLPTLTLGGYISGSGSDIEDEVDAAPKKNRRGQRARQQLWAKKYGAGAKHLRNGKGSDDRKAGWDAKRGATDRRGRVPAGRGARRGPGRGVALNGTQRTPQASEVKEKEKKKHRDDGGAIHPSWEAAKKAKEKKAAPVAFSGKKITFD